MPLRMAMHSGACDKQKAGSTAVHQVSSQLSRRHHQRFFRLCWMPSHDAPRL